MSSGEPFVPPWEREREAEFSSLDYSSLETPCYVVHLGVLEENLKILREVKAKAGCTVLLALKGFAAWKTFPLVKRYLDGVCASSVNEARLGREEFGAEVHAFAPAYSEQDVKEQLTYSDHIIFNSFSQWERFKPLVMEHNEVAGTPVECGIRINPESAGAQTDMYNPCAKGSRMGMALAEFEKHIDELEGISGLHFHVLCEQGADDLEDALAAVEEKFGKYLSSMKWVNFGGGHHITREDYDVEKLVSLITAFKEKYGVEIILEPGEAVALNAGVLVSSVLDVVENGGKIAILDTSAENHMPDVLAMPYRPSVIGAGAPDERAQNYTLGGNTCLSGDMIGAYSFDDELCVGDKVVFQNMAIYTMVKNTQFNGVRLPSIVFWDGEQFSLQRTFSYDDYKGRLS